MARQLRIDYPGAAHHVYSRGNQKLAIFLSDEDRFYFLKVLGDAFDRFGVIFLAYCLMPNHYHLMVRALLGSFSRALHLINTAYSVYLNKKHSRCGHLFQGRFKSILIEADTYAYELSRYIHLNPVRAGMVRLPEDFQWSSYREFTGLRQPRPWLDTSFITGTNGIRMEEDIDAYSRYVLAGIGREPPAGYLESKKSGILGSPEFIDEIKSQRLRGMLMKSDRERPQLRVLRSRIGMPEVCAMTNKSLGSPNRLARSTSIFVSHRISDYTLAEIGAFFKMSVSGVSSARRRIEMEIEHNSALRRAIEEIIGNLKTDSASDSPTFLSESDKK